MNTTTEENKSSRKKMFSTVSIIAIVAIIAVAVIWSQYQPTSAAYVEVNYKTVGWYYTVPKDEAVLVLNLTVTNKGYAEGVNVSGYGPDFSLNISNANYNPTSYIIPIFNSSIPLNNTGPQYNLGPKYTLQGMTLMNGQSDTGTIVFELPKQQYNKPFTLKCAMKTTKNQAVNATISGS